MRTDPTTPSSAILQGLLVFLGYAVFTAAVFRPWIAHAGTMLIGPPEDNLQDFWNSWYAAVAHVPGHFFQTDWIRYPDGTSLFYHSFAYPQIALLVALSKVFGTDHATLVALQGATLLLSFPLAGLGAFYLVRHFTGNVPSSLIGGYIFAFNPSHAAHAMHHAHVAWIAFLPFCILAYLLALERKSVTALACAIVLCVLSALSCWYYLFYLAFFVVFHAIYTSVRDNALPRAWNLVAPLGMLLGTFALLSPLLIPMVRLAASSAAYNGGTNFFVADIAAYFTFPPTHPLSGWASAFFARIAPSAWEGAVYLGLVNLALLAWIALHNGRKRDPVLGYVLLGMTTFCVFASGETLHAFGHDLTFLHLPDAILAKLPFFANLRTPSRAIVMVYLFLAIGAGHAMTVLWESHRGMLPRTALGGLALLSIVDFYPARIETTDAGCPKALDIVRNDRANFAVLDVPAGYVEGNIAMFRQTCHGHPIARGIVARVLSKSLADRLETGDLFEQRRQLREARIKYIILSDERAGLFVWHKSDGDKRKYGEAYSTAYRGDGLAILRVY
jgi:hypothetical protein